MRFSIKNKNKYNFAMLLRKIGYKYLGKTDKQEYNLVKPFERGGYPRFHIYLIINEKEMVFNIHLDQKKPIYKGAPAHGADYEGKVIEQEAQRIKQALLE
ncbi:MAG: hypothetical protein KJI70_00550 [Patescibacteria group bacterium]|nr:hypothetical protein [Patescibacteria group bacterium]